MGTWLRIGRTDPDSEAGKPEEVNPEYTAGGDGRMKDVTLPNGLKCMNIAFNRSSGRRRYVTVRRRPMNIRLGLGILECLYMWR